MKRILATLALAALVFAGSTLGGAYSTRIMAKLSAQGSILVPTTTGHINPAGLLQVLFDGVSTNSTTQNFYTCIPLTSIPAKTLRTNGDEVRVEFLANETAVDVTFQVWLNIGGTCSSGATGFTGGTSIANGVTGVASSGWSGTYQIFRTGSNAQGMRFTGFSSVTTTVSNYTTSAQTDTSVIPLIMALRDTAVAPTVGGIVMQKINVWYVPTAP